MNTRLIPTLTFFAICTACSPTYIIPGGQNVFEHRWDPTGTSSIIDEHTTQLMRGADIREQEDNSIIINSPGAAAGTISRSYGTHNPGGGFTPDGVQDDFRQNLPAGSWYYPDPDRMLRTDPRPTRIVNPLHYRKREAGLKALNITFKNRYQIINSNDLQSNIRNDFSDQFPPSWEGSFSPALAFGYSLDYVRITPGKDKFVWGWSIGPFLGFGTAELKPETTVPAYPLKRKNLFLSVGAYVNVGIQKWDIGLAYGFDHAMGAYNERWVYQRQPFVGIIVGYDLLKFRD